MRRLRTFDIIANTTGFDADWYARTFPDAGMLQMDPRTHYETFGFSLGRGLNAKLPLIDNAPDLVAALQRRPVISYCTPIMNRPEDVRGTLAANLEENRPHQDKLEFVLVFLDDDTETHDWVRANFADDLTSGYLRMIIEPPLDGWHFGKAKNRHRAYAMGQVYSSLDGDNFVTAEGTEQLLWVHETYGDRFVFHHFTGNWGDGSSGRISMPMPIYTEIGYDETFLPRQYDEMDVLMSVMCAYPDAPLIRIKADNHGFSSKRSTSFMEGAGVTNPIIELDKPRHIDPLNPKTDDYVQEDQSMDAMTAFNQGMCFMKNARTPEQRTAYLNLAIEGRHKVIDTVPREKMLGTLFHSEGQADPSSLHIGIDDVCVFACMKNDENFLIPFYEHYKALGIAHFFIVDDGSDTPIEQILPYPDVHVFRPKVGSFITAKGMWMEGLMKAYLNEGQWSLSLDADEFMDLPAPYTSFRDLAHALRARGQETMPALLIDLVPRPDVTDADLEQVETDFLRIFDHYVFVDAPMAPDYANYGSVKWGFGPYANLSWHLDTRYHGFGTFDALRKIPLIQFRHGRHINQGFHTLHYTDKTPNPGAEIWDTDMVLPIRHFKLLKLFSNTARARMAAQVASASGSQYHARTTENIAKIFGSGGEEQMRRVLSLPSKPYADSFLTTLDPRNYAAGIDR